MKNDDGDNIVRGPNPLYVPCKGGLGYEIFQTLNFNRGKIAQIMIHSGEEETYDNLLKKSTEIAIYLSKKKLAKEDVVCLLSENTIHSLTPFIAAKFVGVNYASIEPTLPENDLMYLLSYLQPKILFVSERFEGLVEAYANKSYFKGEIIVLGKSEKFTDLSQFMKISEEKAEFQPVFIENIREEAVIYMSSGTTGKPKGICLSHYSILGQTFNIHGRINAKGTIRFSNFIKKFDDNENVKFMYYSPMYWISGMVIPLSMLFTGGTMITGTNFEAKEAWQALENYEPNVLFLPGGQVNQLCSYAYDKKPHTILDVFLTGGSLVSDMHNKNMKRCFPESIVLQCYGQTETVSVTTSFSVSCTEDLELLRIHPDSCGRALAGVQIKIVDPDTETICSAGMQGELRVKCEFMMNGYYKMDFSSAYDSDGWFKTGDMAYFNDNQCIFIVDRIKDLLLYTLYNIRPSVIENILSQHPAVYESFVIGYPHREDNEHPMGVVILKDQYKNKISQDEIIAFVNDRVPSDRYKIRAGIKFVDKMLRTPSGKLNKIEMKQLIVTGQL